MTSSVSRSSTLLLGLILLTCVHLAALAEGTATIAKTTAGQVRGTLSDGIHVFKGVRYGASTAGRRFQPPQPPKPWSGVVDALEYGNQSPQARATDTSLFRSWVNRREASEDLLFLNIWTPKLRDGAKRPVMVWFHGGGFVTGSGSSNAYDGTRLAKKGDVVVVTVNHRLNAFGYLYLAGLSSDPTLADAGNAGNLDMLLSLQWVRDNIAEFGGDPGNVLIFGESGGGSKVSTLLAMPSAVGLFHKAVVQSGSTIRVQTPEAATRSATAFLQRLGLTPQQVGELRTSPMEKITAALDALPADGSIEFRPVVDNRSLPRQPFDPDAPPSAAKVPLLVGTNKDETTLLIGNRDASTFAITWEDLPKRIEPFSQGLQRSELIDSLRKLYPQAKASDLFFTLTTFRNFRAGALRQAELKAAQAAPAYLYELVWETPVDGGKWHTPHALDIGMVFDNVARSSSMSGTSAEAQKVADQMSAAWLAFAHTGKPGWPAYDAVKRTTMLFDVKSRVVEDPYKEERLLLSKLPAR